MVRNPNFEPTADVPATNPDQISLKIVQDDSAALQQVINGQADYDFHPIPVDRLADVQSKYGDQLKIYTPANTYYFFMNQRTPPFDKLAVRQAVNYAIDRNALVKIFGGPKLAVPNCQVLPPGFPGNKACPTRRTCEGEALIEAQVPGMRSCGARTARRRRSRSST